MNVPSNYSFRPILLELFTKPYTLRELRGDVIAGLTVGLVALPLTIGFSVASIPSGTITPYGAPAAGIFTAIIAGILIGIFGGTRFQIPGPSATMIPISILMIERYGFSGLLVATFIAGIILVIFGLFKIGSLMKYLPWSVVSGFTTGIAISIIIDEIGDFLGIRTSRQQPHELFDKLSWLYKNVHTSTSSSILIASATLIIIYFWSKKGFKQIPSSIVSLFLVTLLVSLIPSQLTGPITTIGSKFGFSTIPSHLPSFSLPSIKLHEIPNLLIASLAIVIPCAVESLLAGVISDRLTGTNHNRNTELIAQGISNMTSPFFGGLPSTGMIVQTSLNVRSGARTPIAALVYSLTLLLVVLLFSTYVTRIPMGVMAAILIAVALNIGEWRDLRRLFQIPLSERCILLTALLLTIFFNIVVALEASMLFAAMVFIKRITEATEISYMTTHDLSKSPKSDFFHQKIKAIPEGVLICSIKGPLLFGVAEKLEQTFKAQTPLPTVFILKLDLVSIMDATALNVIEIISKNIHQNEGVFILCGINTINRSLMERAKFIEFIGEKNFCMNLEASLERSRKLTARMAIVQTEDGLR